MTYVESSYLDDHLLSSGSGAATATWSPGVSGRFEIFVTWDGAAGGASAQFSVEEPGSTLGQSTIDQSFAPVGDLSYDGSQWQSLGVFDLTADASIVAAETAVGGAIVADAIRLVERLTVADDIYSVGHETTLVVRSGDGGLIDNDQTSAAGLAVRLVDDAADGALFLGADGSFHYTPGAGFVGQDSFTYYWTFTFWCFKIS